MKHAQGWLSTLRGVFGLKFIIMLCVAQHVTKGFVAGFTGSAEKFVFEQYGVDAGDMTVYRGVIGLPWAVKPVIGVVSDFLPINGYSRGPYIVLTAFGAIAALGAMAFFQTQLPLVTTVMLMTAVALYMSTTDLLTEAQYARKLREHPQAGPDLISFVWGGMYCAGILATLLSGPVISHYGPFVVYAMALLPTALVIWPASQNYLEEEQLSTQGIRDQRQRVASQHECLYLCAVIFAATMTLSGVGVLITDKLTIALVSLGVMVVVLFFFSVLLNPVIAKVNAFSLIQTAVSVGGGGAGFFFMTDGADVYPAGPHFSIMFYATVLPLVGSIFGLMGIMFYNQCMRDLTYPYIYILGNTIVFLASLVDLLFYLRWNESLGVPDHVFVLGTSAFESVIGSFLWMPSVVIMSQLCPKGMEAIMYALLAGCHNLGNTLSSNFSAFLLLRMSVLPNGKDDDTPMLENLWKVSLVGSILPMLCVVLVPFFIPNRKQTESLSDGDVPATAGSYWRKWWGIAEPELATDEERQGLAVAPAVVGAGLPGLSPRRRVGGAEE